MHENRIQFAIIGLDHAHAYNHAKMLLDAGAEFAAYYSDKPQLVEEFATRYPQVRAASTMAEILEDSTIDIIAGAAMPADRADISIKAMQHGKDVVADKPAVTSLEELAEIERVQRETGRIWCLYSNEHHDRRCTVLAGELVAQGAIGRVIQTTGFGPHSLHPSRRPAWFWDKATSGGILGDIGAHQIEQFLFFTGSSNASVVHAQTGNFANQEHPGFEDYGEVALTGDGGVGWFRVDWCSPASLGVPGDIRLFLLGTEGYMEMRKYADPAGQPGGEHLLLVNSEGARFVDTTDVKLTFGTRLLDDVRNRTETAMPQDRSFLVTRLAMEASLNARRLGSAAH
jgi:predicted dehydrogenase